MPSSSHAIRGRARSLDDDDERAALLRRAVAMERSAVNVGALAIQLAAMPVATEAQLSEAQRLADEAAELAPDEPWGVRAQLAMALVRRRDADARRLADRLFEMTDAPTAAHSIGSAVACAIDTQNPRDRPILLELSERAYHAQPDDLRVLGMMTEVASTGEDVEAALPYARRAVDRHRDQPLAYLI